MRTHTRYFRLAVSVLMIAGLTLSGCVDAQDTLPASSTAGIKVHPDGWQTSSSEDFHGKAIRAKGWDLSSCQACHGKQYTGGTSGKSCRTCHSQASGPEDCATCHGSSTNPAPPRDTEGNTATSNRGVGAHQAHLLATSGKLLSCGECHMVPTALMSVGHIDTTYFAEVHMDSALANLTTGNGTIVPNPSYDPSPTSLSCSSVYCHGTFKNGNPTNVAKWTDATTAVCGTCHGDKSKATTQERALPKTAALGGSHPANTNCSLCHTNINASGSFTNAQAHIDGNIALADLSGNCSACHGSSTNAAPPIDLAGNTMETAKGVGAHQAHLVGSGTAKQVACTECHIVPTTVDLTGADGHIDATTGAEVGFSGTLAGLATTGVTPNPAYTSGSATCASTYCHGSFTNGNLSNAPVWNSPAGTAAQCGSCHGDVTKATTKEKALPKTAATGGTHPAYTECQWCHTSVTAGPTFTNADNHVDGTVPLFQWSTQADCSRCHGSTANAAPPQDLAGNTTSAKVGAHQVHLSPSTMTTNAVACSECHVEPTNLDYTGKDGHLDGSPGAELVFGTLASTTTTSDTRGTVVPSPVYSSSTRSCGSTYCHGTFTQGNLTNAPVWDQPSTAACGTCHGDPVSGDPNPYAANSSANHSDLNNCSLCHYPAGGGAPVASYNSTSGTWTITDKGRHMDGKLTLSGQDKSPWYN